jgi:hypothetical protein
MRQSKDKTVIREMNFMRKVSGSEQRDHFTVIDATDLFTGPIAGNLREAKERCMKIIYLNFFRSRHQ